MTADNANRSSRPWRATLVVVFVALVLAVANLLVTTLSVLLLVFAGLLFGVFLNGLSGWLSRYTRLPYRVSFGIVVALLLGIAGAGFYFMGGQIAEQTSKLASQLQDSLVQAYERLEEYEWAKQYLDEGEDKLLSGDGGMVSGLMRGVQWLLWGLTAAAVIFFVGLYMAWDPELYRTGLVNLVPLDRRARALEVLSKLHATLGYWIAGRLLSMTIVGVLTAIGLWILGVPLAVTLGVLAALLTFIPNIGPILAAIPQALMALNISTQTVIYVIALNVALQTVESYLLTPIIERYQVTLPPAVTIVVQLLMGVLVGVIGVMMAAPLTAAAMVLIQMLYIRDRLGDPSPGRLAERA